MSGAVALPKHSARLSSLTVLTALTALFVLLAVIGGFRGYSPVPFWDMWKGYVSFLDQAGTGDWSAWWAQHNEHRIVLARLFFWADLNWFGGAGWFLIIVNYLLVGLGATLFWRILRDLAVPPERTAARYVLGLFITAWLFFWSQNENLTWGFQSQFILAQLVPLAALYTLYRSLSDTRQGVFALACVFGVASAGAMANGVLALPLMTMYLMLMGQSRTRIGLLGALSALTLALYFHNYSSPAGHGSLSTALRQQPLDLMRYVLLYLGGPFNFMLRSMGVGKGAAQLAGLFFLASSAWFAARALRAPRQAPMALALLFFIAYIVGTAVGTAGGRLIFGLDQALSNRYTTPALMAWAALVVLYAPFILSRRGAPQRIVWGVLAAVLTLMLPFQLQALHSRTDELFERSVGALAIEMRIKDKVEISHVYLDVDVIAISELASEHQRSVFGMYPFQGARAQLGRTFAPRALPACQVFLDSAVVVAGDVRFLRVAGWLFEPTAQSAPHVVRFLDADGKSVGYALGGETRDDVATAVGKAARHAGYRGYLAATQAGNSVTVRGEGPAGPFCQSQVNVPMVAYAYSPMTPTARLSSVGVGAILPGNTWLGGDYDKSVLPGMAVYGSFIHSDADVGSISLRLTRGDKLFYRSGPVARSQSLEIEGGAFPRLALPVAKDWVLLDFSGATLPQGSFTIKLTDEGKGWGEWSAIAISKQ